MHLLKKVMILLICMCIISYCRTLSDASFLDNLFRFDEIDVPTDFSIEISDTYTENKCIVQADANKNGDFATMTYNVNYAQDKIEDSLFFSKKFVDIFNSKGEFVCELIFVTEQFPTLRMSENFVYLLFFNTVLVFNFDNREIKYYSFAPVILENYPEETISNRDEFVVGKWNYKLSKPQALGYRQLTRSSDEATELLIQIPKQINIGNVFTVLVVGFSVYIIIRKKRKTKKAEKPSISSSQNKNYNEICINNANTSISHIKALFELLPDGNTVAYIEPATAFCKLISEISTRVPTAQILPVKDISGFVILCKKQELNNMFLQSDIDNLAGLFVADLKNGTLTAEMLNDFHHYASSLIHNSISNISVSVNFESNAIIICAEKERYKSQALKEMLSDLY